MLYDLFFGKSSVKRWIVDADSITIGAHVAVENSVNLANFGQQPLGRALVAFVLYQTIELFISFPTVREMLIRCYKLDVQVHTFDGREKDSGEILQANLRGHPPSSRKRKFAACG